MIGTTAEYLEEEGRPDFGAPEFFYTIGNYAVPPEDVLDGGVLKSERGRNFSDFSAAEHTLRLDNSSGKYSPGLPQFIFAGQDWYLQELCIYLGFRVRGTQQWHKILRYRGLVLKWGKHHDKAQESRAVEIYSKDKIALLLDRHVGEPLNDGSPNPLVLGQIVKDATELKDRLLWAPDKTADFETGDWSQLEGGAPVTSGSGAAAIATPGLPPLDPSISSLYCAKYTVPDGASNSTAYGKLNLPATGPLILLTASFRFNKIPTEIAHRETRIMQLLLSGGGTFIYLAVGSDGKLWVRNDPATWWKETSWNVNQGLGVRTVISLGACGSNPGMIKVYVNNDEVFSNKTTSTHNFLGGWAGLSVGTASTGNDWEINVDDFTITDAYYPQMYYVPGAPYQSIDAVFIDNALAVKRRPRGKGWHKKPFRQRWKRGHEVSLDLWDAYPQWGAVNFNDYANPPSGTVLMKLTKGKEFTPLTVTVSGGYKTFDIFNENLMTQGFAAGDYLTTSGFVNAGNNGVFRITSISYEPGESATVITCAAATTLVDETKSGVTISKPLTHPVDQVKAVLEAVGLGADIDQANFLGAKSLTPDDATGCYFEDIEAAEALKDLMEIVLYSIFAEQGQVRLQPYQAAPLLHPVMELTGRDLAEVEHEIDLEEITTVLTGHCGWYPHDPSQFCQFPPDPANDPLVQQRGRQAEEWNADYGESVSSESTPMMLAKTAALYQRLRGPCETLEVTGAADRWRAARLELGDEVLVNLPRLFATPQVFAVDGWELMMSRQDSRINLTLVRFPGEGEG